MGRYDNAKLVSKVTGEEIKQGDIVPTFRNNGEEMEFLYVSVLPGGGSSGKVLTRQDGVDWEYYPSVLRAYIKEEGKE